MTVESRKSHHLHLQAADAGKPLVADGLRNRCSGKKRWTSQLKQGILLGPSADRIGGVTRIADGCFQATRSNASLFQKCPETMACL